jgi:uncharacterized protein with PIN domain
MNNAIKLQWYSDPGHAWLKVSRADVQKLGLCAESFTHFSYQSPKGNTFYLEEDCDAPLLLDTLRRSTQYLPTYRIDRYTNGRSHIRLMRSLTHTTIITKLWNDDALDKLEQYIHMNINLSYQVPRPSTEYPWNGDLYREVYQACIDYIRESGRICYARTNGEIVVTTDQELAKRDLATKLAIDSSKLHIVHVR